MPSSDGRFTVRVPLQQADGEVVGFGGADASGAFCAVSEHVADCADAVGDRCARCGVLLRGCVDDAERGGAVQALPAGGRLVVQPLGTEGGHDDVLIVFHCFFLLLFLRGFSVPLSTVYIILYNRLYVH